MTAARTAPAGALQSRFSLIADLLSGGRRSESRLVTGDKRGFGLNRARTVVHVPYPVLAEDWGDRALTCGIALQCAPSKDRIARHALDDLKTREQQTLILIKNQITLK